MSSFDSQLRQLIEDWRSKISDDEIISVLKDEVESLQDAKAGDPGAH